MTPLKTKQATTYTLICLALIVYTLVIARIFSPHQSGAATPVVSGCFGFSSPSSEARPRVGPGFYRVTAYCPCEKCCGKCADGYTASGRPAVGKIVAAPSTIPFGTVLKIPGYGVAAVQDRGGTITGNRLGVLFDTHQEALNWGVQELMVKEIK